MSLTEQLSAMCGDLLSYPNVEERTAWARTLISRQKSIYEDPDFYSFFTKADVDSIEALITRWYGQTSLGMFGTVLGFLDDKFVLLLLDPGLFNHGIELAIFGRNYESQHPNCTPFELRNAFSNHLGQRKVYRGMVLTEEEARTIERGGILAAGMSNLEYAVTPLQETFDPYIFSPQVHPRSPIDELVARHTDLASEHSQWISVSQYPQVAASIGYYDSGHENDPKRHLYLYEIELPVISVIEQKGVLARSFLQQEKFHLVIGDDFNIPMDDLGVEMFVPFAIPSASIQSVRRYDNPPPRYSKTLR